MKKKTFLFGLILLVIAGIQANAINCPYGWTSRSTYVTVGNYTYSYNYCYCCNGSTSPGSNIGGEQTISKPLDAPFDDSIWELLKKAAENEVLLLCTVPPCNGANYVNFTYETPMCWKTVVTNSGSSYTTTFQSCPGAKCVRVIKYCQDQQTNVATPIPPFDPPVLTGTPCASQTPADIIPPADWDWMANPTWVSNCYQPDWIECR